MTEFIGYVCAAFIGIVMGMIGGGGSILTLPVLVYLFGLHPLLATTWSLFIVGTVSWVGAINNWRKNLVVMRTGLLFGITSVATVFIVRRIIIPSIPEKLFQLNGINVTFSFVTMLLFSLVMLAASFSMIRSQQPSIIREVSVFRLLLYGVIIGIITGFLGAGGGFLIVPVLVVILRLPMLKAVGTSMFIIALNSTVGFLSNPDIKDLNWTTLFAITLIAIVGVFIGMYFSRKVPAALLKKSFGWFVLAMSLLILVSEIGKL